MPSSNKRAFFGTKYVEFEYTGINSIYVGIYASKMYVSVYGAKSTADFRILNLYFPLISSQRYMFCFDTNDRQISIVNGDNMMIAFAKGSREQTTYVKV